jgi:RNA polymerase sigma-70 factor (ECF subfamily)
VIVLRYYADLKHAEIADQLDIPPGTVRWRLHAALKQLRRMLRADALSTGNRR